MKAPCTMNALTRGHSGMVDSQVPLLLLLLLQMRLIRRFLLCMFAKNSS